MQVSLPIKTLCVTLVLEPVPRRLPKNTEEVIFPLLNELQVPKIVVSLIRVSDKPKRLPKIVDRSALLVEPEKLIARPIIGVSSIWALVKVIVVPITGELFAVVPHNESAVPMSGEA